MFCTWEGQCLGELGAEVAAKDLGRFDFFAFGQKRNAHVGVGTARNVHRRQIDGRQDVHAQRVALLIVTDTEVDLAQVLLARLLILRVYVLLLKKS